jgi:hypothetical protein
MIKKFTSIALAGMTMLTLGFSTVQPANAGGRDVAIGIGAGIIGLGILGAAANAHDRDYYRARCYPGPERCGWSDRHCYINNFGDEVCRGGRYSCYRPRVCD